MTCTNGVFGRDKAAIEGYLSELDTVIDEIDDARDPVGVGEPEEEGWR
ncbi:hypothetical protein [Actinoallomurus sp. NPDC050550]